MDRELHRRGAALAAAATLTVFARSLGWSFVDWDDPANFVSNPAFVHLSRGSLVWAWTRSFSGHYHPLTWMSLFADRALWGLDARGYHFTSAALHACAA